MERKQILEILTEHCTGVESTKENRLISTKVYLDDLADELVNLFAIHNVVAMLPSEYSWQKHKWKSEANLKTTINELITLKDLSKKELILLVELIKDHLGN